MFIEVTIASASAKANKKQLININKIDRVAPYGIDCLISFGQSRHIRNIFSRLSSLMTIHVEESYVEVKRLIDKTLRK